MPRESFGQSLKLLFTNKNFLVLTFSFFCANGSLNGISTVLEEIFSHYDYSSPTSYCSLVSCFVYLIGFIGSLGFGLIADKTKKLKLLLIIANFMSAACLGAFTWVVPLQNKWLSAVVCCVFGFFNIATIPLSLELASEITYPVGEANSGGIVMCSS